jgi:fructose-bisphosphate aldolase class I
MDIKMLNQVALQLLAPGKGILAADESTSTAGKRFDKIGLENTEENRRAYREMLFTAPNIGKYISGVIMYDETLRQGTQDGKSFVELLQDEGVLPGIKVDESTYAMPDSPNEKLTKGLEGLPPRLAEYAQIGAKFTKWRAVITIGEGIPTDMNIRQNAKDLAAYAKMAQEAGLVPIVEPEVLMDWSNTQKQCAEVSERVLSAVFEELKNAGVAIEGMILKTNMAVPGKKSGEHVTPQQVADLTLEVFKKILPDNLPGQAFLSGGQSEKDATENLNEMNKRGALPWKLSFSYGRALQDSALTTWKGMPENVALAQEHSSNAQKLIRSQHSAPTKANNFHETMARNTRRSFL